MACSVSIHKIKNEVYDKKIAKKQAVQSSKNGLNSNNISAPVIYKGSKKYKRERRYSSEDEEETDRETREEIHKPGNNKTRETYFVEKRSAGANRLEKPDHKNFKKVNIGKEALNILPLPRRKRACEATTLDEFVSSP